MRPAPAKISRVAGSPFRVVIDEESGTVTGEQLVAQAFHEETLAGAPSSCRSTAPSLGGGQNPRGLVGPSVYALGHIMESRDFWLLVEGCFRVISSGQIVDHSM